MTTATDWPNRFPDLFAPSYIDYANADVRFTVDDPPDELVSRIHCVAVDSQHRVIVCRSAEEWRFLPGGTREPGESLTEAVRRELLEEAGAAISSTPTIFASQIATSHNAGPYRPHMPHPLSYWAFAMVDAEVVQPPTNPEDGEQVDEVRTLEPAEAARWIGRHDPVCADVVRLADAMGLISSR